MTRRTSETTGDCVNWSLSKLFIPEYSKFHSSRTHFQYEGNCGCNKDFTCRKLDNL
jgi:hypothetical protein